MGLRACSRRFKKKNNRCSEIDSGGSSKLIIKWKSTQPDSQFYGLKEMGGRRCEIFNYFVCIIFLYECPLI